MRLAVYNADLDLFAGVVEQTGEQVERLGRDDAVDAVTLGIGGVAACYGEASAVGGDERDFLSGAFEQDAVDGVAACVARGGGEGFVGAE